jgi:hypothetical protein
MSDEEEDWDEDDVEEYDSREVAVDRGALDDMLSTMSSTPTAKARPLALEMDSDEEGGWRDDLEDEPGEAGRLEYEDKWRWCRLEQGVLIIGRTDDPDDPDVRKELKLHGATIEQVDEFISVTPHKKDESKDLKAPSEDDASIWTLAFQQASAMASPKKKKKDKKKKKPKEDFADDDGDEEPALDAADNEILSRMEAEEREAIEKAQQMQEELEEMKALEEAAVEDTEMAAEETAAALDELEDAQEELDAQRRRHAVLLIFARSEERAAWWTPTICQSLLPAGRRVDRMN